MKVEWLWAVIALQFSLIIAMAAHFMSAKWYWWAIGAIVVMIVLFYAISSYFKRAEITDRDPIAKLIENSPASPT